MNTEYASTIPIFETTMDFANQKTLCLHQKNTIFKECEGGGKIHTTAVDDDRPMQTHTHTHTYTKSVGVVVVVVRRPTPKSVVVSSLFERGRAAVPSVHISMVVV